MRGRARRPRRGGGGRTARGARDSVRDARGGDAGRRRGRGRVPSEAAAAAAAAAAVGPALEAASAAAAAQFRRARDGDDADAAAEMAAANPLRSAALGGGFGGLMFGRSQDRSAADDAATEVSGARVGVLELARFARGLTLLSASGKAAPATVGGQTEAAKKEIVAASDDGALVALRCVLATGAFRDEAEASRRAYLALARETLRRGMRAALADADLGEALAAVTPAMTADRRARGTPRRHRRRRGAELRRDRLGERPGRQPRVRRLRQPRVRRLRRREFKNRDRRARLRGRASARDARGRGLGSGSAARRAVPRAGGAVPPEPGVGAGGRGARDAGRLRRGGARVPGRHLRVGARRGVSVRGA